MLRHGAAMNNAAPDLTASRLRLVEAAPAVARSGDHLILHKLRAGLRLQTSVPLSEIAGIGIDVQVAGDAIEYVVSLVDPHANLTAVARCTSETAARRLWSVIAGLVGRPKLVAAVEGGWRPRRPLGSSG